MQGEQQYDSLRAGRTARLVPRLQSLSQRAAATACRWSSMLPASQLAVRLHLGPATSICISAMVNVPALNIALGLHL